MAALVASHRWKAPPFYGAHPNMRFAQVQGCMQAASLLSQGGYTTLNDSLAASGTVAESINDKGQVVG